MNSKERVHAALQHKQPDRVPASIQAGDTTWERLRKHFMVETNEEVMEILQIDTRLMEIPPYIGPNKPDFVNAEGDTVHTHPFGYRYIDKWNGAEYDKITIDHPLQYVKDMADFNAYKEWPNPDDFDYEAVKRFCDENQDKAVCIGGPGVYQAFLEMYPAEEFYMLMADDPDLVKAMLKRYRDFYMEMYERMFEAGDGGIDLIRPCDDYGTQRSLLFSRSMWDGYFADSIRKLAKLAHRYGCYYLQHSGGAISEIIPRLIECGVDALGPIQRAAGMELKHLKEAYGDRFCFQGGVDIRPLLLSDNPEQVRKQAEQIIKVMSRDGGYIFGPSQSFEADIPIENILTMYRAREAF
ncbi:MAG: uroporphyrinogen decarboxylase family protein [Lachnospiraceae bacterium]|nr:uroporphyrinogen decarboxylase family protein [Lachnospiraceae bacterium]